MEFNELIRLGAGAVELQALAGGDVPWEWMGHFRTSCWPFFRWENQRLLCGFFQDRLPVVSVVGEGFKASLRSCFEACGHGGHLLLTGMWGCQTGWFNHKLQPNIVSTTTSCAIFFMSHFSLHSTNPIVQAF